MKKQSDLSRLMGYAGNYRYFTYASWVLSAVSALVALVPFVYIWKILRDVLNAAPDYAQAVNIPHYGWMAVLFAVLSYLIYIAALMCSHLSAFRVATNLRLAVSEHLAVLPLGFAETFGSGKLRKIIHESTGAAETYLAHQLPDQYNAIATPVGLPVEDTGEVSFAANITTGGQTSREEVTSYSDIARLLPLTNDSSSYSNPTYRGGNFQIQYDLGFRKQYGTEVIDPVFQVLKNGDSVRTLPAKISESTVNSDPDAVYYTPDTAEGDIVVSCQPKDTVELHLLCRDSFGLSYDFTVCTYAIGENGDIARIESDTDYNVRVSWEK